MSPSISTTSLIHDHLRLGRLGQTRGLYVDCVLDGAPCRALIDTGSTISLVRPGILPGTLTARPPGWEATKLRITTVTGERADLNGRKVVRVRINQVTTHHQFWLANIQDECILGLDLLEKWGAMVDVSQAQLHLGADTVSLQATGNACQARQGFATSPTQAAPLVQEHRASTPARRRRRRRRQKQTSPHVQRVLPDTQTTPPAPPTSSPHHSQPSPSRGTPPSAETKQALQEMCLRSCEGLDERQCSQVRDLLDRYADIFAARDEDCTRTSLVQHEIDTGDARPIRLRPRRLPFAKRAVAEQKVKEMAEAGVIEPSNSVGSTCSPRHKKRLFMAVLRGLQAPQSGNEKRLIPPSPY